MRVDALADPGVEFVHAFLKYRLGDARGPHSFPRTAWASLFGSVNYAERSNVYVRGGKPQARGLMCSCGQKAKRANIIAQAG